MTNEEAIKGLKISTLTSLIDGRIMTEEKKIAMQALEKQIPIKPTIKVYDDEDEETHKKFKWKFYLCAVCGENLASKTYTHCHCGQAIDWSEEK